MDSTNRRNLIIGLVVGVVVGVLLGMALFWGPFAVEWTDAHSYDLAPEARARHMALVADSFALDKDPARAAAFLQDWQPEEKQQAIADASEEFARAGQDGKVQAVNDLALALAITPPGEAPPTPPVVESPVGGLWDRFRLPCLVFLVVLLILVLGAIGIRVLFKDRPPAEERIPDGQRAPDTLRGAPGVPRGAPGVPRGAPGVPRGAPGVLRDEPGVLRAGDPAGVSSGPLGQFFTTYQLGEDTYDESFSIEAPTGEFLGECGMGISETIGEGEPDRVSAFEVWLFDKSDIRTVTKVLMSEYAFHDDAIRAKLAPKGEAVLAQPGSPIILETSGLGIQVDVAQLEYGEAELPPNSFFAKLVVELVAMAKPADSGTSVY